MMEPGTTKGLLVSEALAVLLTKRVENLTGGVRSQEGEVYV
jgi:hypothetical protein